LIGPTGEVRPKDRRAIEALLERGVHVTLCTGRMFTGTQPLALELGLDAPLACVDGSHVAHSLSGRQLACSPLRGAALETLLGILVDHEAAAFAFSDELLFHDEGGMRYLDYVRAWSRQTRLVSDLLISTSWQESRAIPAVLALGSEERMREAELALAQRAPGGLQGVCFESLCDEDEDGRRPWALLVRAAGVDKGTGVAWLAEHYGVGLDEIVAVGDWLNDVPMFGRVGLSFAMAQAPDVVKEAASSVLDSDDLSGCAIAEAAERAGLL
jgi:HAD superfamily hydrolase (TIGR01484 family)